MPRIPFLWLSLEPVQASHPTEFLFQNLAFLRLVLYLDHMLKINDYVTFVPTPFCLAKIALKSVT